ncbi:hypothetical protein L226DRAFT_312268 [Lentinus tigrinus ALCF2SS1-7]|uniref:uncharacterized protein n=1 Tax=Lentinus tigrinus ALCF2SS1-7 TaxID=1328758 RepID=UPI0011663F8A|nr:hypothetical protein L226DRAFT_312268 [Lentinus tigrinus ALCF2SS1-7]
MGRKCIWGRASHSVPASLRPCIECISAMYSTTSIGGRRQSPPEHMSCKLATPASQQCGGHHVRSFDFAENARPRINDRVVRPVGLDTPHGRSGSPKSLDSRSASSSGPSKDRGRGVSNSITFPLVARCVWSNDSLQHRLCIGGECDPWGSS